MSKLRDRVQQFACAVGVLLCGFDGIDRRGAGGRRACGAQNRFRPIRFARGCVKFGGSPIDVVRDRGDGVGAEVAVQPRQNFAGIRFLGESRVNRSAGRSQILGSILLLRAQPGEGEFLLFEGGLRRLAQVDDPAVPLATLRLGLGIGVIEFLLESERLPQLILRGSHDGLKFLGPDVSELGDRVAELVFGILDRIIDPHQKDVRLLFERFESIRGLPVCLSAGQQPESGADEGRENQGNDDDEDAGRVEELGTHGRKFRVSGPPGGSCEAAG